MSHLGSLLAIAQNVAAWSPDIAPPRPAIGSVHGDNAVPCPNIHHGAMIRVKWRFHGESCSPVLFLGIRRPPNGTGARFSMCKGGTISAAWHRDIEFSNSNFRIKGFELKVWAFFVPPRIAKKRKPNIVTNIYGFQHALGQRFLPNRRRIPSFRIRRGPSPQGRAALVHRRPCAARRKPIDGNE